MCRRKEVSPADVRTPDQDMRCWWARRCSCWGVGPGELGFWGLGWCCVLVDGQNTCHCLNMNLTGVQTPHVMKGWQL